ncbi:MAG: MerR family transcriptional regulator, partial [Pseudomonadota bacterium]|nr:MerR family transcriptional regulator [Pseudomonadota bacterium]
LRLQQKAIVQFMEAPELDKPMMTIESWSELMRASGMDDDDMRNWHKNFEAMEPEGHQRFLESLNIGLEKIKEIRDWSR